MVVIQSSTFSHKVVLRGQDLAIYRLNLTTTVLAPLYHGTKLHTTNTMQMLEVKLEAC